jgi:nucleotide-binding universal stress UspA family protein
LPRRAERDLEEARNTLGECPNTEFRAEPRAPVRALIEVAERVAADLIVVPGGPARALRRGAPCPVLRAADHVPAGHHRA